MQKCLELTKLRSPSVDKRNRGFLPLTEKLRSSSVYKKMEVVFHLPKKLRSSNIVSLANLFDCFGLRFKSFANYSRWVLVVAVLVAQASLSEIFSGNVSERRGIESSIV